MNHLTRRSSSMRPMSQINVVPYIDVMLVLLVIFMITAPLMNPGKIDLPSIGKALAPPVAPLEVIVHRDASLALHDRSKPGGAFDVSRNGLVTYLKSHRVRENDQPVVISADKRVRYEEVIKVMDLLQREQVRRVGLLVQTK